MRRAEIRTTLDRPEAIAAAIRPDNTPEMATRVENGAVQTTIERETTGGLRSTVDDYVVNLDVARRTIEGATRRHPELGSADGGPTDPARAENGPTDTPPPDTDGRPRPDEDE